MDKLDEIFEKQKTLQERLGTIPFKKDSERQEFINIMSLALIDEIMEAIRETPWKPWKKQQEIHEQAFKEEIIDAWHFLINLSIAAGMTPEMIRDMYVDKNKENHDRQNRGY